MGSTGDKIKGTANEAAGRMKKAAGDLTGNRRLKAEGAGQEAKGKMQKMAGKAKDAVKSAVDKL
ncbi:MAG: CsbD family protein [Mesorhizobium sp.]